MRLVYLRPAFAASKRIHAPADSPEDRAVMRVVRELADDSRPLPAPGDVETRLPPSLPCFARPIPSAGLLVCYAAKGETVFLLAVMRAP